jgi:hypothetical protein
VQQAGQEAPQQQQEAPGSGKHQQQLSVESSKPNTATLMNAGNRKYHCRCCHSTAFTQPLLHAGLCERTQGCCRHASSSQPNCSSNSEPVLITHEPTQIVRSQQTLISFVLTHTSPCLHSVCFTCPLHASCFTHQQQVFIHQPPVIQVNALLEPTLLYMHD